MIPCSAFGNSPSRSWDCRRCHLFHGRNTNRRRTVQRQTIWIADAHRGDGKRFVVHSDEKLSAFVELEREVLTVTFYLESVMPIRAGDQ